MSVDGLLFLVLVLGEVSDPATPSSRSGFPELFLPTPSTEFLRVRLNGVQHLHLFPDRNSRRTGVDLGILHGGQHWSSEIEKILRPPWRIRGESLLSLSRKTELESGIVLIKA